MWDEGRTQPGPEESGAQDAIEGVGDGKREQVEKSGPLINQRVHDKCDPGSCACMHAAAPESHAARTRQGFSESGVPGVDPIDIVNLYSVAFSFQRRQAQNCYSGWMRVVHAPVDKAVAEAEVATSTAEIQRYGGYWNETNFANTEQ